MFIPHSRESLRQKAQQIRGNQGILAKRFTGEISSQSVKVNRKCSGFKGSLRMLRDKASEDSGQYVAGASSRHARIARRIHPYRPVR